MNNLSTDNLIKEWITAYTADLYHWAFHKTGDKETAEDLVQETFLAALKSAGTFRSQSQVKTWLFGILKNKIADHYRQQFRNQILSERELSGEQSVMEMFDAGGHWKKDRQPAKWTEDENNLLDDPDFLKVFSSCMEALPLKWKSAVKLKFLEEKKGTEICQELEISTTNFWQILHRAKLKLRECLEHEWFHAKD